MVREIKAILLAVASTAILASSAVAQDSQNNTSSLAALKAELNQLNLGTLTLEQRVNLSESYRKTFEGLLESTDYEKVSEESAESLTSFQHLSKNIPCFLEYMTQSDLEAPYSCA